MVDLEQVIRDAAEKALDGELTNDERVNLYRLALTVATSEIYRLAQLDSPVAPESLLIIQQIGLLADDDVTPDQILGGMGLIAKDYLNAIEESEDSEASESAPSELRESE